MKCVWFSSKTHVLNSMASQVCELNMLRKYVYVHLLNFKHPTCIYNVCF